MAVRELSETITVPASATRTYALISDVTRMGRWSPECRAVRVAGGARPAHVGMRFTGYNRASWLPWQTTCTVVEAREGEVFAFEARSMGIPLSRWTYRLSTTGERTDLTEMWQDLRSGLLGRFITAVALPVTGVADRAARNRQTMRETLRRIRADLEHGEA